MEIGHQRPFLFMCLSRSWGNRSRCLCVCGPVWVRGSIFLSFADDFPRSPFRNVLQTSCRNRHPHLINNISNGEWKRICPWHILLQVKGEDKTGARSPTNVSQTVTWNLLSGIDSAQRLCMELRKEGWHPVILLGNNVLLRSLLGRCVLKSNKTLYLPPVGGLSENPQAHRKLTSGEMSKRLS